MGAGDGLQKKKFYGTREEVRSDIFDYIEMFYNSKRRYGSSDQMSPTEYKNPYYQRPGSIWVIRDDSVKRSDNTSSPDAYGTKIHGKVGRILEFNVIWSVFYDFLEFIFAFMAFFVLSEEVFFN